MTALHNYAHIFVSLVETKIGKCEHTYQFLLAFVSYVVLQSKRNKISNLPLYFGVQRALSIMVKLFFLISTE